MRRFSSLVVNHVPREVDPLLHFFAELEPNYLGQSLKKAYLTEIVDHLADFKNQGVEVLGPDVSEVWQGLLGKLKVSVLFYQKQHVLVDSDTLLALEKPPL